MRYLVFLAFNGQNFYGTQRQKENRTIQGLFEDFLSQYYQEDIKVTIASRLDRYVNALSFALAFSFKKERKTKEDLQYVLNRMFAPEVYVTEIVEVAEDFSPRYDCTSKTYCYLIQKPGYVNPLLSSLSYIPDCHLDIERIKEALPLFQGTHEFSSFATLEGEENTLFTINSTSYSEEEGMIYLRFKGKAFLRYQVRFMVGALLSYGNHRIEKDDIIDALAGKRELIKVKAEPQGLFLEEIEYPSVMKKTDRFCSIHFYSEKKKV